MHDDMPQAARFGTSLVLCIELPVARFFPESSCFAVKQRRRVRFSEEELRRKSSSEHEEESEKNKHTSALAWIIASAILVLQNTHLQ